MGQVHDRRRCLAPIALAEGGTIELAHLPRVLKAPATQEDDLAPSESKKRDESRSGRSSYR